MHWICLCSLSGRHVEKSRVKEARLLDKASIGCMTGIADFTIRIVVLSHVKAIFRDLDRISFLAGNLTWYTYFAMDI